jgi:hypothetical protein
MVSGVGGIGVIACGAGELCWTSLQLRVERSRTKKDPRGLSTMARLSWRMAACGAAAWATEGGEDGVSELRNAMELFGEEGLTERLNGGGEFVWRRATDTIHHRWGKVKMSSAREEW